MDKKVNRNNHPILVKARRESYYAGRKDGYNDGYKIGYQTRCDEIHRFYKIIIHALEAKVDLANKEIRKLRGEVMDDG